MIDEKKLITEIEELPFIHGRYDKKNANPDFISGIESMYEIIKALIERQTQVDEWIPCSERLPEIPEDTDDKDCPEFNVMIEGASVATTLKYSPDGAWFDDLGQVYEVIAWMPLPEPWEEGN